ncbi:hypothetical protein C0992_002888 [Termitomyces sp. T32_za158]|nr:hypothetical protein C0992_002888 [Termitomyces sp. T32_za158]
MVGISIIGSVFLYFLSPVLLRKLISGPEGSSLPPGPPNRYAFLRKYPERALHAWQKTYGPLFSIWMGRQLFIVISDPQIAQDLLVTNGSVFSSRKQYFMKSQVILRGRAITASIYGDKWRQHRRIASQALSPKALQEHSNIIDYEAHMFIRSLYEGSEGGLVPIDPANHCDRFALNIMLMISFATRTCSTSVPLIEKAVELGMEFMALAGPWSNAIDFLEPLQWIPTKMRARGHRLHDGLVEVYGNMIDRTQARMDRGEDIPDCLVKTLIKTREKENLDREDLCMLSTAFMLGGVHSTSGIIKWFLALIPSHPEIQARAHEELDRVIGRDRWPTIEDEQQLPYTCALIKEVQRIHSPFWSPTPHYSTEDFVYKGMFIPKNTAVVLDCYTLHHNEELYPNAYLGDTLDCCETKYPNAKDRDLWTFGAGRRICPGLSAAEHELWLAISRLLWSFRFESLPEEPINLTEYEGSSGRTPLPFRLKFLPRVEKLDGTTPTYIYNYEQHSSSHVPIHSPLELVAGCGHPCVGYFEISTAPCKYLLSRIVNVIEASKKLAAYTAVDKHIKPEHIVGDYSTLLFQHQKLTGTLKIIGIGSGSTVPYVVDRIVQQGVEANKGRIFVPTGFQSKELIVSAGLTLGDVDQISAIDVTIDGADEVDKNLNCIKGGGACHLREKVIAEAASTFVVVADYRKNAEFLGTNWAPGVPIEVVPFAYVKVLRDLKALGSPNATLRMAVKKAGPVVTDNGNFVIDAPFAREDMLEPATMLRKIKLLTGVVEVGLFCNIVKAAYFGNADGSVSIRKADGTVEELAPLSS